MFNLEPSEEQKMLQDMTRSFASEQMRTVAHECDEACMLASGFLDRAWALGLVSAAVPAEYGGTGFERSAVAGALAAEELSWGDLSLALAMLSPALFTIPVLKWGTPEQKKALLPLACGDSHPHLTAAVMEPFMLFDPAGMRTAAVRANGSYVLNGRKCLVPLGGTAEKFIVYAARDGQKGYENVLGLVVDRAQPGLTIGGRERNMGISALDTVELELEDVTVGGDAVLGGEEGMDFKALVSASRVALCALAVGTARAANEYARQYALERNAFGEPIAHRQAISFMLAEDYMEIEGSRLLTWESAWRIDAGLDAFKEAYLAKLYIDQVVVKVTDDAVQTLGGHGYIREHPVERWLRNGRGFCCFEGLSIV
ncbi:MAG TPA: acyl-CoA dehydrogenase family protein [Deltaproteobacteria bacterium]|jgi:alkylation response protein AidB-like acyl-CoA dehydrogenase|nr:acyl-CoA dehydrogenase family protein [Deltaproteobacteria bacterium]HOI08172.1 acyl-CoA dehydrogenase family protein [Deltaproteobacteria bacterium]